MKDFVINQNVKGDVKMDNESSKPTDHKVGLRPKVVKPLKSLGAINAPSSRLSFRPTRSVSAVKSILPVKVAPLGVSGPRKED